MGPGVEDDARLQIAADEDPFPFLGHGDDAVDAVAGGGECPHRHRQKPPRRRGVAVNVRLSDGDDGAGEGLQHAQRRLELLTLNRGALAIDGKEAVETGYEEEAVARSEGLDAAGVCELRLRRVVVAKPVDLARPQAEEEIVAAMREVAGDAKAVRWRKRPTAPAAVDAEPIDLRAPTADEESVVEGALEADARRKGELAARFALGVVEARGIGADHGQRAGVVEEHRLAARGDQRLLLRRGRRGDGARRAHRGWLAEDGRTALRGGDDARAVDRRLEEEVGEGRHAAAAADRRRPLQRVLLRDQRDGLVLVD